MPTSASPPTRKGFDYASLDAETTQFVQQQTGEIRVLMKRTAQGIVEIGCRLVEIKRRLGHGRFGAWLSAEFEWSDFTARQFMNVAKLFKSENFSKYNIAPSALYELAAPSTPEVAREEALARAEAGEAITYTTAKAIKQKYATPRSSSKAEPETEPEPEVVLEPQQSSTPEPLPPLREKPQIVAIHRGSQPIQSVQFLSTPQASVAAPETVGVWWQLGGRHLLYCGEPDCREFLERIALEKTTLMLAFPSTPDWQTVIQARTRIISTENLPQRKDSRLFEEALEANLLLCSDIGDAVVACFLPSLEILSIINRLERRGIFVEPDSRRVNAVISDWKRAGMKAERLS